MYHLKQFDGTLDWSEFVSSANKLIAISNEVNDNWVQKQLSTETGGLYLAKTEYKILPHSPNQHIADGCDTENILNDIIDPQEATQLSSQKLAKFEYHIVYSISYSVPVLYFTANKPDGSLVKLEEIWECIPKLYNTANEPDTASTEPTTDTTLYAQFGSMLTQMEHPLLQRPFYAIHPCHTSTLLRNILSTNHEGGHTSEMFDKDNYLITWLSTIGPIAGIQMNLEYGKHLIKHNE